MKQTFDLGKKNSMNLDNERQLRFFHYADENKELNTIQEQNWIPGQISPWKVSLNVSIEEFHIHN